MRTISTYVDVDVDLDDFDDDELAEELRDRGYVVNEGGVLGFDTEDWKLLLEIVDSVPETVYTRRVLVE